MGVLSSSPTKMDHWNSILNVQGLVKNVLLLAYKSESLTGYANIIVQTNNLELRQTLIQMRNQDESHQRTVYSYALQTGQY